MHPLRDLNFCLPKVSTMNLIFKISLKSGKVPLFSFPPSLTHANPNPLKSPFHPSLSSSTLPHPHPLTPLLSQTISPQPTLFLSTQPSTHNPIFNAHLLVVPTFPPWLAAGVIHCPSRRKYGVVMLPSMISPCGFTRRISAGKVLEGGSRARASS